MMDTSTSEAEVKSKSTPDEPTSPDPKRIVVLHTEDLRWAADEHVAYLQGKGYCADQKQLDDIESFKDMDISPYSRLDMLIDLCMFNILMKENQLHENAVLKYKEIDKSKKELYSINMFGSDFDELLKHIPRNIRKEASHANDYPKMFPISNITGIGGGGTANGGTAIGSLNGRAIIINVNDWNGSYDVQKVENKSEITHKGPVSPGENENSGEPKVDVRIPITKEKQEMVLSHIEELKDKLEEVDGVRNVETGLGSIIITFTLEKGHDVTEEWIKSILLILFDDILKSYISEGEIFRVDVQRRVQYTYNLLNDDKIHENCVMKTEHLLKHIDELREEIERLQQTEKTEPGSLAQTVLGSCQSTSSSKMSSDSDSPPETASSEDSDSLQETDSNEEGGDGDLSHLGASQTKIKSFTVKQKSYQRVDRGKSQTWTKEIGERTTSKIEEWTRGMVKTSPLAKVMEKLNNGVKWITIKGSPGEGKTTVALMALDVLHKSGRQVFKVMTPQEFSEVTMTCSHPVVLLDDIFGNLEFDQAEWIKWKPVLFDVLGEKEHRSHEKKKTTSKEKEVTVILVGRDYVLNTASCDMGRISEFFTLDSHVVDMSKTIKRDLQEKHAIWEAISNASGVELGQKSIDTICKISCPHGFPHVCHMFVTLYQEDENINAEQFFKAPLEFLNQTVQKLMQDTAKLLLFKEMVKKDGKVSVCDLETVDNSQDMKAVADSLVGTYLRKDDGCYIFDHPSIYDSVAFNLCKRCPLFVIENCKLSFLHERLRLEPSCDTRHETPSSESGLVVDISRSYLRDLARRFAAEISNRNLLQVLSHKVFTDKMFIKEIMSLFTKPKTQLLELTDIQTGKDFLSLIASSKSRELLKYIDNQTDKQLTQAEINTVLYGVCRYAASDVLTYLVQSRYSLDMNVRNDDDETPLMIAAGTRDSQFVHQIMSLNPDLNARDRDGTTVLHYLCENGLVSAVRQVIDGGTDIDVKNKYEWSPLWYACGYNHVEVVRLLLDRGARWDAETVVDACEEGNMDVVILLFERGATVDKTADLHTPLTAASSGGHVNLMKFLIDKGASVNTADGSDMTPLHRACYSNKTQAVQWLLDHGADMDSRDEDGDTPLHTAAWSGSNECVDVLLKAGADVNVANSYGNTPLHTAVERGSNEYADVLLKAGADLNAANTNGNTPLHTAVERGSNACVDVLLKAGADVNATNTNGNTPLHTAIQRGSNACVDLLLKAGADVNAANTDCNTPLHEAVLRGSYEYIDVLLKADADLNVANTNGNTPLHEAAGSGSNTCLDVLVKAGAYVNVVNTDGDTPLHKAAGSGSNTCVDVLLKAGADVDSTNIQGQTPLHTAVYYTDWDGLHLPDVSVCQTLISSTADVNKQDTEGNTPLHQLCKVDSGIDIYNGPPPSPAYFYTDVYRTLVTLLVDNGADVNIHNNRGEPALRGWCQKLLPRKKRKTGTKTLLPMKKRKTRTKTLLPMKKRKTGTKTLLPMKKRKTRTKTPPTLEK